MMKFREFEEYEERRSKMVKWQQDKERMRRIAKHKSVQREKADYKMKLKKQEMGENAFKEWLKKSIEDLKVQKQKVRIF